jgi:putative salt-induced outer membrane protein YdiY
MRNRRTDDRKTIRTGQAAAALALGCLIAVAPAGAGDEDNQGWVNSSELSLVATSGNSETTTLALKHTASREWQASRFKLELAALRAESDTGQRFAVGTSPDDFEVIDPSDPELTAENYAVSGRYEGDISEKLFWFAGGGWEKNEFAGIANRYVVEAGAGNVWFKSDSAHFITHYALTGTRQEDVIEVPGASETFLGLRLDWDYFRQLTATTSYANLLTVDENLDETSDLRADLDQSLAVTINERLALKASLTLRYDAEPALEVLPLLRPDDLERLDVVLVELDELDVIFKTALVVNF